MKMLHLPGQEKELLTEDMIQHKKPGKSTSPTLRNS
jgi:hypothetical protein